MNKYLIWGQSIEYIFLKFDSKNITNEEIIFNNNELLLNFNLDGVNEDIKINLYKSIIPELSNYEKQDYIYIILRKEKAENWKVISNENYSFLQKEDEIESDDIMIEELIESDDEIDILQDDEKVMYEDIEYEVLNI